MTSHHDISFYAIMSTWREYLIFGSFQKNGNYKIISGYGFILNPIGKLGYLNLNWDSKRDD